MLRPKNCTKCGARFYTADPKAKTCGDCSGASSEAMTKRREEDHKNSREVNARPASDQLQTADPRGPQETLPTSKGRRKSTAKTTDKADA